MAKIPFIHLHNHTDKSFKDGHSTFASVIDRCIENEQPGIAVTEHGNMYDSMGFYLKCKDKGIKNIFGSEVYMLPEGSSATVRRDNNPDEESDDDFVKNFHLVVLAYNNEGLTNLHTILSIANECGYDGASVDDHFYYNPRVKFEELEKYSEGLIVLSACMGGEIPRLIAQKRDKEAIRVARKYKKVFGKNFYLEIMDHTDKKGRTVENQYYVNKKIIALSNKLDIPLVLTNDCHYSKKSDAEGHKLLKCVSYGEDFYNATNYNKYYPTKEFYIKNSDEMLAVAKKYGKYGIEAYKNTYRIFKQVNVTIDSGLHFPKAKLPKGIKTANEYIRKLTYEKASEKYDMDDPDVHEKVVARIEKELGDITKGQFPDYFLNAYDIVKNAKDNEILIGAGRGSGAGSIVANILNITDVDPLEFDLIWERFWNPGRCKFAEDGVTILKASPPDIDIDVPGNRRMEVIEFCKDHFGWHRVANIITFGTFKAFALIRDGSKALHTPEDIVELARKAIPYGGSPTLEECLVEGHPLYELCEENDEVKAFIDKLKLIDGRATNASTHAGGVLITDVDMYKYTPVFKAKNGLTTQYPYETLESIGCLKIDLLGHEAEVVIDRACTTIKERHNKVINPYSIPNNDEKTFKLFQDIRMNGIPQLQSDWVIPIIQNVQPQKIGDIIDLVTMIRPGSLDSGQTEKYQNYCLGEKVKPDVPELKPIVAPYKNCLLYQEQIMNLAVMLAGFSLDKADELRKVCAKTKYAHLAEPLLKELIAGMNAKDIPQKNIDKIIEIVKSFFAYSFNKAHAAGYGITSYRVAWLKANYFIELTCAQLNSVIGDQVKTNAFLDEVIGEGYKVYPPDINISTTLWECKDDGIVMPLTSIKGVGDSCVSSIVEERELKGDFKSFEDFVGRTPGRAVKKNNIVNLILVGAFDSLGYKRKSLFEQSDDLVTAIRNSGGAKALFGNKKGNGIKDLGEFSEKEIKEEETELLGQAVTLSEKDLRIKKKQIARKMEHLKEKANRNRKEEKSEYSKKSFGNKHKSKGTSEKLDNNSLAERLRRKNKKKRKAAEQEPAEEGDSEETSDIKNSLREKLNLKKKKEAVVEQEPSEKIVVLEISISDKDSVMPEKIFKRCLKHKSEDGIPMTFFVKFDDGSEFQIVTDFSVKASDALIGRLEAVVGKGNVVVKEYNS